MLRNERFQKFLLGYDKELNKNHEKRNLPGSQDPDILEAHGLMVMNCMGGQFTNKKIKKSKDEILDDFIYELFTNKITLSETVQRSLLSGMYE